MRVLKYFCFLIIGISVYLVALRQEIQQSLNFLPPLLLASLSLFFTYWIYKKVVRKIIRAKEEYEVKHNQFFPVINNKKSTVEGKNVIELLSKYGSPLFVLSHRIMKNKYDYLTKLLNKTKLKYSIAYSFKTNNVSYVCQAFKDLGTLAEVVSGTEYTFAKNLGYRGDEIIFNGPLKDNASIRKALKEKAIVNIDNFEELHTISRNIKNTNATVGLRINTIKTGLPSRFGFNLENGEAEKAVLAIRSQKNIELIGIHSHIGSNISSPRLYSIASEAICNFCKHLREKYQIDLQYIDMGGGFPVVGSGASYSSIFSYPLNTYIKEIVEPIKKYRLERLRLILEPGRFLIDESFVLLAKVISIKTRNQTTLVTTDASVNILPLAKSRFQYVNFVANKNTAKTMPKNSIIYGASCIENDILVNKRRLPRPSIGDIIVFYNAGAYNISQSNQFIFLRPATVSIRNDKIKLIRKKETPEYIWNNDIL